MRRWHAVLLGTISFLLQCTPSPNIDLLAPNRASVGEVIDIRDPLHKTLGTAGTVFFGSVPATRVLTWTPTDVYVEVPDGIPETVDVRLDREGALSNIKTLTATDHPLAPKVMCFGDSLGYWGFPKLEGVMAQDPYLGQFDPVVLNQGTRGEKLTGPGTLDRWCNAVNINDNDFVVLMEGCNDVTDPLLPSGSTVSLENLQQRLMDMTDEALAAGTTLILCTLPPRVDSCGDKQSPTTEEYNDWLRSYAAEMGIPLVDVYQDFISTPNWAYFYFGSNCLHPIEAGYIRIAQLIKEKILALYLPTCSDLDMDGYGAPAAPPCPNPEPDCNDCDPDINPGTQEDCMNMIDDDCDGLVDFSDPDCPCWDDDEDGFGDVTCGGTDCDDSDPGVNPGVTEGPPGAQVCNDGIDNDCDDYVDMADVDCQQCSDDEECQDGLWCNGHETCVDHACQAGTPIDCDDGIDCTEDGCDEDTGSCENTPSNLLCDDGDTCTDDVCDPLSGCQHSCNASGPGDPCCEDPACIGAPECEP